MDNKTILLYVIRVLVIMAQTSDMSPVLKQTRVNRLLDLADEIMRSKND